MKNVLLAHFRAIPVHSGLFPGSKSGQSGDSGLISRFWRFRPSLSTTVVVALHTFLCSSTVQNIDLTASETQKLPRQRKVQNTPAHCLKLALATSTRQCHSPGLLATFTRHLGLPLLIADLMRRFYTPNSLTTINLDSKTIIRPSTNFTLRILKGRNSYLQNSQGQKLTLRMDSDR